MRQLLPMRFGGSRAAAAAAWAARVAAANVPLVLLGCGAPREPEAGPDASAAPGWASAWVLDSAEELGLPGDSAEDSAPPPAPLPEVHNVLFILTDDQRADTLWAMPTVKAELVAQGVTFADALIPTPMCCPSRTSLLAGGFADLHTHVLANDGENGGLTRFDEARTLPVAFQTAGFRTGFAGKYVNGYVGDTVPPGWDSFGSPDFDTWDAFTWASGSSTPDAAGTATQASYSTYLPDFEVQQAVDFLEADDGRPFFYWLALAPPHEPATPDPADEGAFADFTWRGGAWGEVDRSDKPAYVQEATVDQAALDALVRDELRTLQSVDRGVARLLATLEATGHLDDTLIVYSSDNGRLWGEHGLQTKGKPYVEALKVPLVIRAPGVDPATYGGLVAANLDVAATFAQIAGAADPASDGRSLLPVLAGSTRPVRDDLLVEFSSSAEAPPWAGIYTPTWAYAAYADGFEELYDRVHDTAQLENVAAAPPPGAPLAELRAETEARRGLVAWEPGAIHGDVGQPLTWTPGVWGGQAPLTWSVDAPLPEGLTLDAATGIVSGTPLGPATGPVMLSVTDSSASPYDGAPQTFRIFVPVHIGEAAPALRKLRATVYGRTARVEVELSARGEARLRLSPDVAFDRRLTWSDAVVLRRGELTADLPFPGRWYAQLWVDGVPAGRVFVLEAG